MPLYDRSIAFPPQKMLLITPCPKWEISTTRKNLAIHHFVPKILIPQNFHATDMTSLPRSSNFPPPNVYQRNGETVRNSVLSRRCRKQKDCQRLGEDLSRNRRDTPPKTNMEPENGPLEKEIPIGFTIISRFHVNFWGCTSLENLAWEKILHSMATLRSRDNPAGKILLISSAETE